MTRLLSLPADGYLLRHGALVGQLGPSVAHVPLLKDGVWARGYVLLHRDSLGLWQSFRLRCRDHASAEATAKRVALRAGRAVLLGELAQASPGGVEVIRALSTHEPVSEPELIARALAAAARLGDVELRKADPVDPYKKNVFERLSDELAGELTEKADPRMRAAVERTVDTSRVDWSKPTERQLETFSRRLATALGVAAGATWMAIKSTVEKAARSIATAARPAFVKAHKLEIGTSTSLRDQGAVARATGTTAHYVRDFATGELAPSLSVQARGIIQQGIERGAGSVEIGKDLHSQLSAAASGQTESYFRVVASAVNGRSRAYSSLRAMEDARIEQWEWSSVLDERTTETCRFLHGRVFTVANSLARYRAAAEADDPTDVRWEMPWYSEKRIRTGEHAGKMGIFIRGREQDTRVAVIEKGGFGERDAIGRYSNVMSADGLEQHNHSPPPAHGH